MEAELKSAGENRFGESMSQGEETAETEVQRQPWSWPCKIAKM